MEAKRWREVIQVANINMQECEKVGPLLLRKSVAKVKSKGNNESRILRPANCRALWACWGIYFLARQPMGWFPRAARGVSVHSSGCWPCTCDSPASVSLCTGFTGMQSPVWILLKVFPKPGLDSPTTYPHPNSSSKVPNNVLSAWSLTGTKIVILVSVLLPRCQTVAMALPSLFSSRLH